YLNATGFLGFTPLERAVQERQYEFAEALLNAGADPLHSSNSALAIALKNKDRHMVMLLCGYVDSLNDPNIRNQINEQLPDLINFLKSAPATLPPPKRPIIPVSMEQLCDACCLQDALDFEKISQYFNFKSVDANGNTLFHQLAKMLDEAEGHHSKIFYFLQAL